MRYYEHSCHVNGCLLCSPSQLDEGTIFPPRYSSQSEGFEGHVLVIAGMGDTSAVCTSGGTALPRGTH